MNKLIFGASQVFLSILLAACSASPSKEHTGNQALKDLQNDICPPSIIDGSGKNAQGNYRYSRSKKATELTHYRNREIDNCTVRVGKADTRALAVLVDYWNHKQQPARVVDALELYMENGDDSKTLGNSGAYLYRVYSRGAVGVPVNHKAAFANLSLAIKYGVTGLELNYADELQNRGLYKLAMDYYRNITNRAEEPEYRQRYSTVELCDAGLQLAQLYFNGRGGTENWNLGYYYWHQGMKLAQSPQWGSCVKDNFVYGDRYSNESARKTFVDARIALMDPGTRRTLDHAIAQPRGSGLALAENTTFKRPAGAPSSAAYTNSRQAHPASWIPLAGPLCELNGATSALSWSELFARRASSIWTVSSVSRGQKTLGSAVAVGPRQLVTNCHLISNPAHIELRQLTTTLQANLVSSDKASDRCILQVSSPLRSFVTSSRAHAKLKVGEDVAAIGNPKGLDSSLSRGIVAQKRRRGSRNYIQTDTAISTGSSGGGLFDRSGNLVGITTFTIADGQSLNFALAVEEFCRP